MSGDLSDGWECVELGEITDDILKVNPKDNPNEKFTYLDIGSIDNTIYKIVSPKHYLVQDAPSRARQLVKSGDILFSTVRTYLKNIAMVDHKYDGQVASTGFCVIRPILVHNKYLFYLTFHNEFLNPLSKIQRGTSYPAVRNSDVYTQLIPLPPLPEQDRIVSKIEELFTRLEAGVEALKQVQTLLKRYRQSVLKSAVEGQLTAEWREQQKDELESANKLLERILKERKEKWEAEQLASFKAKGKTPPKNWQNKYKEPTPPDTSNLPELPEGWVWVTAEQLSDETRSITYGVVKLGDEVSEGVPTLRSSNIRHLKIDFTKVKKISQEIASNYKRTFLKGGEVLVTVRGTLGGVVPVSEDLSGYNISREVAMIAPIIKGINKYISFFIGSPVIQNWLKKNTRGVAYTGINIETLKRMPLPLVPELEYPKIVEEIERFLSIADDVEVNISNELNRIQSLRQSILKRAFEGKLVPQDPNDEPASVLLDRIKAEKSNPKKSKQMEMF